MPVTALSIEKPTSVTGVGFLVPEEVPVAEQTVSQVDYYLRQAAEGFDASGLPLDPCKREIYIDRLLDRRLRIMRRSGVAIGSKSP